jgi:hypothetical protein
MITGDIAILLWVVFMGLLHIVEIRDTCRFRQRRAAVALACHAVMTVYATPRRNGSSKVMEKFKRCAAEQRRLATNVLADKKPACSLSGRRFRFQAEPVEEDNVQRS